MHIPTTPTTVRYAPRFATPTTERYSQQRSRLSPPPGRRRTLGRYELGQRLGSGGMAQLYLARQRGPAGFEHAAVIKTLTPGRDRDPEYVAMFLDEARVAATLHHVNIVQVFEVGCDDGVYFMAMEHVDGKDVREILRACRRIAEPVPLDVAIKIAIGAAAGLHHAHEQRDQHGAPLRIVHRDVSPANILVGYDGSVKVVDFGIAKAEHRATETALGTIKGKIGYMSPEQCSGGPIDRRSDIFALGILLYEITTLHRAFERASAYTMMDKIKHGTVTPPTQVVAGYPRALEAIVMRALAPNPAARFQTAQELIDALESFAAKSGLYYSDAATSRFLARLAEEPAPSPPLPEPPVARPSRQLPPPELFAAERDLGQRFGWLLVLFVVALEIAAVVALVLA